VGRGEREGGKEGVEEGVMGERERRMKRDNSNDFLMEGIQTYCM